MFLYCEIYCIFNRLLFFYIKQSKYVNLLFNLLIAFFISIKARNVRQ